RRGSADRRRCRAAGAARRRVLHPGRGELHPHRRQPAIRPGFGPIAAIDAWKGPFGSAKDFELPHCLVEVKARRGGSRPAVSISSEDQLDTARSHIVLCQQGIATAVEGAPEARSLNQLVAELRAMVASAGPFVADRLELALFDSGWDNRPEYDFDRWQLVDRTFYEVREGFPRIVRADLLPGVEEVRYRIRAADCADFRIDIEETLNGLLG
ncbi:MAG: PD-(D/E)XK motif protein, partial [Hyphomonas sp.]|nr:PD-(D/E)XK motif protein [Hyphomonas sp.]